MKNFFEKSIIVCMLVVLCSVNAAAQKVVTSINTSDFSACKEYLTKNPNDTVSSNGYKVFIYEGRIVRTKETTVKAVSSLAERPKEKVVSVIKSKTSVHAITASADTIKFNRTNSNDVAYSDKVAVLQGSKVAVNPAHKDLEGDMRHRVYASVVGGAQLFNNGDVSPIVAARLGYETCHFLFEIEGAFGTATYSENASVEGTYHTYSTMLKAGWKFWNSRLNHSYLAAGLGGGYCFQKTDVEGAYQHSENNGLTGSAFLRGLIGFNKDFGLVLEAGYRITPRVEHYGGEQDLGNGGAYAVAGLNYRF